MSPLRYMGAEIVPDPPPEPQYMLVGPKVYAMFTLASDPDFWLLNWRKRKRLWRKARERAAK